jgi:Calx-beta domain-containing protein
MIRKRRSLTAACVVALVGAALITTSASGAAHSRSASKPLIAKPTVSPAQAVAGKRFTVTFKVTSGGKPLTQATLNTQVTAAGAPVANTKTFRGGTARVSFIVPARAQGKSVKVKLTVKSAGASATRTAAFPVKGAPSMSIATASSTEGNVGTTTLSFPVTLSAASAQAVTVDYATADGSASAPGDYAVASGKLTFAPGEKSKTITVSVVGDLAIEQDESFTVSLSNPVNATIAAGSATGTISNDDTQVPVTAGEYKGATQEGNYVFFTLTPNRTVTAFRVNDLPEKCNPGGEITGGVNFGDSTFVIAADGSFTASGEWRGSDKQGDVEWTYSYAKVTGTFNGNTVTGKITVSNELNYKGTHYTCTTGDESWSATLQG